MKPTPKAGRTQPAVQTQAWRRHVIPMALLWAATLLAYSNSFHDGLVYDSAASDSPGSRGFSPRIRRIISSFLQNDYWYPALGTGLYRPLTTLSFLFNYAVLGNEGRPEGYHVITGCSTR